MTAILNRIRGIKQDLIFETFNYGRFAMNLLVSGDTPFVNDKEVRVSGLQRSGNHAVIGWIRAHYPKNSRHLNNCPTDQNPYQYLYRHYQREELKSAARGIFLHRDLLLISYENKLLKDVASKRFGRFHDIYVGSSGEKYDVLVIRDPFNLMASQLKAGMCRLDDGSAQAMIRLWISYAEEFVGKTEILNYKKVSVNFNRWHVDASYRKQLAEQMGFQFTDAGREQVRGYGGGSSFDDRSMDNQGSKMDILSRWRAFESDQQFWQLFRDDSLLTYVDSIFDVTNLPLHYVKR
jgi:hypothetical protein